MYKCLTLNDFMFNIADKTNNYEYELNSLLKGDESQDSTRKTELIVSIRQMTNIRQKIVLRTMKASEKRQY